MENWDTQNSSLHTCRNTSSRCRVQAPDRCLSWLLTAPPPGWADLDDRSRPLPCTEFTCRSLPAVTHLHPRLGQVDLHGEVFPCEHVRVMCLRKGALQLLQLKIEHRRYLRSLQTPCSKIQIKVGWLCLYRSRLIKWAFCICQEKNVVFTPVRMWIVVFGVRTPRCLVDCYHRFRGKVVKVEVCFKLSCSKDLLGLRASNFCGRAMFFGCSHWLLFARTPFGTSVTEPACSNFKDLSYVHLSCP